MNINLVILIVSRHNTHKHDTRTPHKNGPRTQKRPTHTKTAQNTQKGPSTRAGQNASRVTFLQNKIPQSRKIIRYNIILLRAKIEKHDEKPKHETRNTKIETKAKLIEQLDQLDVARHTKSINLLDKQHSLTHLR